MEKKNIYNTSTITHSLNVAAKNLSKNLDQLILAQLKREIGNKCIRYGYVDKNSISILKRSLGKINSSHLNGSLTYHVSYKADICNPIDGQIIECEVKNINKMGLLAENQPLSIVLARQHHVDNDKFETIEIGDMILVEIIGKRFELYDEQITAIGKLQ